MPNPLKTRTSETPETDPCPRCKGETIAITIHDDETRTLQCRECEHQFTPTEQTGNTYSPVTRRTMWALTLLSAAVLAVFGVFVGAVVMLAIILLDGYRSVRRWFR